MKRKKKGQYEDQKKRRYYLANREIEFLTVSSNLKFIRMYQVAVYRPLDVSICFVIVTGQTFTQL